MCIPTGIALGYVYGGLASDVFSLFEFFNFFFKFLLKKILFIFSGWR